MDIIFGYVFEWLKSQPTPIDLMLWYSASTWDEIAITTAMLAWPPVANLAGRLMLRLALRTRPVRWLVALLAH